MKFVSVLALTVSLAGWLPTVANAGAQSAVSADEAHLAVSSGAFVIDVRETAQFSLGRLPGAASLPPSGAKQSLADLAMSLSQAGIDSSRTILIVGEAGDANAQALWQQLAQVATGRVLWLVGGVTEWQLRGHALTSLSTPRAKVPQFLTVQVAEPLTSRMAGSRVRSSAALERNFESKVALGPY